VELKTRDLFAGRLRRRDYVLRQFVAAVVVAFLGTATRPGKADVLISLIAIAIALVSISWSLAWAARRLHDMDQSGWWSRHGHLSATHKADAVERIVAQAAENSTTVFTTPRPLASRAKSKASGKLVSL